MKVNNKIVIWIVVSLLCITMLTIGYGIFNRIVNSTDLRYFIVSVDIQVQEPQISGPSFMAIACDEVPTLTIIKNAIYDAYPMPDTLNRSHSKLYVRVYMIEEVDFDDYSYYFTDNYYSPSNTLD